MPTRISTPQWTWPPRPSLWMGALCALAFVLAYLLLGYFQFYHWLITNGLLFSLLWASPRRWWGWWFGATIVARLVSGMLIWGLWAGVSGPILGFWQDWPQLILGSLLEPFLVVTGVLALHRWRVLPGMRIDTRAITLLHAAAALSALAVVAKDVLYVLNDGFIADVSRNVITGAAELSGAGAWERLGGFAVKNFMGGFVGIMLMAPFAFWLASAQERADSRHAIDGALKMTLPAALLFVLLGVLVGDMPLSEVLRLLLLAVVAVAAVRDGWRGAALAVLMVSLSVAVEDHLGLSTSDPVLLQMFIAIGGAMGLMFGASIDDLRRQGAQLEEARSSAALLAEELSKAASGNLQAEERERHRIAGDLHDEFGQNLMALQTQLQFARADFLKLGKGLVVEQLLEMTRAMRDNISRVLERLHPAVLDELGLYGAIDRGALRRMAEQSGLVFRVELAGDARLLAQLDDTHRIAAYRTVQECVTNVVRHAKAVHCNVRLRIERRNGATCLFVDVRDDGAGGLRFGRGHGLVTMRDRVTALGGRWHVRSDGHGVRVHVLLRRLDD